MSLSIQSSARLKDVLTRTTLEDIRSLWYGNAEDYELYVPEQETTMRWFKRDDEFDAACRDCVGQVLEAIRETNATAEDILSVAQPACAIDYLSLVLLLDQMPRNLYRGDKSVIVFKHFDPIAQSIAQKAIGLNIPTEDPAIRYRLAYRIWFYLPYMHSENLRLHEQAVEGYEKAAQDFEKLFEGVVDMSQDPKIRDAKGQCRAALEGREDAVRSFIANQLGFERRHQKIIQQFGRYPHRNKYLGRDLTKEETEYLENGGDTFGG